MDEVGDVFWFIDLIGTCPVSCSEFASTRIGNGSAAPAVSRAT